MKIVVLDGYTMNPGDLDWEPLLQLGECHFYERTPAELLLERAAGAEILVTNKVVLSKDNIEHLPALRYIGVSATGYNVVDVDAARAKDIVVTNVPAYSTMSVAQMVFAHLLNLTNHVAAHAERVKAGAWTNSPDFAFWDKPLVELDGLTLGILGLGRIGRAVAALAVSFGMKAIFYMPRPVVNAPAFFQVDLPTLFSSSDFLTLHCPLNEQTYQIINSERLSLMKKTAYLINTGRGLLVDEPALAKALNSGQIAGAALDVLSTEPPRPDNPLLTAKNCFITPHNAWATRASRQRLLDAVVNNVQAFMAGEPVNVVS